MKNCAPYRMTVASELEIFSTVYFIRPSNSCAISQSLYFTTNEYKSVLSTTPQVLLCFKVPLIDTNFPQSTVIFLIGIKKSMKLAGNFYLRKM